MKAAQFTSALLDGRSPPPAGLLDPAGRPAGKRFDVYRNNVVQSLIDALETGFPVLAKLLGEDSFSAVAQRFVRAHPPNSPLMMFYGEALPAFLEGLEALADYPYLADVARLEILRHRAYHAADAEPIDARSLATLPPEQLMAARFTLAPACQLLCSRWPVLSIWQFNMVDGAATPQMQAENIWISRPEFDPELDLLSDCEAEFIAALCEAQPMAMALERAEGVDLSRMLTLILQRNTLIYID